MNWIPIAVSSFFLFAIVSILDSIILKNYIKNELVYLIFNKILLGLLALILIFFVGLEIQNLTQLILSLVAGIIFFYGLLPAMKAFKIEEPSRMAPLWNLVPMFVLILSTIFLNERLSQLQYLGFAFLVVGGVMISTQKLKNLKLSKGFCLMLLTAIIFSIYFILNKFIFSTTDFWHSFILIRIGTLVAAVLPLFIPKYRKEVIVTIKRISVTAKSFVASHVILDLSAIALMSYAIFLDSVSLVNASESLQSVFTFIIALFLTWKFPRILKEKVNKKIIIQKIVSILIIAIGLCLINLS